MPSAILMTHTAEGFVLAADGRARENGEVKSDKMQKVFQAGHLPLAYALCGRATFDSNNATNVVDLFKETPYALAAIPTCDNADSYSMAIGCYLATALNKAQDAGDFAALPTKETDRTGNDYYFAHLFLAGYFCGQPAYTVISLGHSGQKLLEPRVCNLSLRKKPRIYGSTEIEKRLFYTNDAALASYRVKAFQESDKPSLSDGIEALKNYIRACTDPEIAKFDPEICAAIGGHIHVATVTKERGFEWIVPPLANGL